MSFKELVFGSPFANFHGFRRTIFRRHLCTRTSSRIR
jgi:hypothetical protein